MIGLAWIEVTLEGAKKIPLRIDDIHRVWPAGGGAQITFKQGGAPLDVTESAEAVGDLIYARWTEWTTAVGDPA